MGMEKACMKCMRLIDVPEKKKTKKGETEEKTADPVCEYCQTSDLSDEWSGIVIILDPKRSAIAAKMGIDIADKFALKVR